MRASVSSYSLRTDFWILGAKRSGDPIVNWRRMIALCFVAALAAVTGQKWKSRSDEEKVAVGFSPRYESGSNRVV